MKEKEAYELMVKEFLESDLHFEGYSKEVYHRKKYKGKSGLEHEFDIAFEFKGAINFLVVVECKELKNKATKQQMEIFSSRIKDISAHKGIFVTTNGYDSGSLTIAISEKISLFIAKDALNINRMIGISSGSSYYDSSNNNSSCDLNMIYQIFPDLNPLPKNLLSKILKGEIHADKYVPIGDAEYYEKRSSNLLAPTYFFVQSVFTVGELNHHYFNFSSILTLIILDTLNSLQNAQN